ncbi:Hypothetical protein PBC10988_29200 [Planctomycetales bacterium 10988]|nr:Hypothetical protein PBC10988_29200 [Planctomycetales bacterium 10988]
MIDFAYLHRGLCGLAHAHQAGTMAGHLGAAVVAGYFFGEDLNTLPDEVFRGVEGELDRIIAGEEAIWFNAKKAGVTPAGLFQEVPKEKPIPEKIDTIATALSKNIGQTRQSGHNVIFASIALRALHDHPEYATPTVVTGIRKLTEGFHHTHAGRGYYGKEKGWRTGNQIKLSPDPNFPVYPDLQTMVETTIDELIATADVPTKGFGGLWHLINHAAALVELDMYGYSELAKQGLAAHHQHLRLMRTLPVLEEENEQVVKSTEDPREPDYWDGMLKRDGALLTHRIKTLYGFYTLRRNLQDEKKGNQAEEAFLYLIN